MSDIRKRTGRNGTTYQVRTPDRSSKSGYTYTTFQTMKEARAFREDAGARRSQSSRNAVSLSVPDAVDQWLDICEKEGLNGREPVTNYTLDNYAYRAEFIKGYDWTKSLNELTPPDVVAFRGWLLRGALSRDLARKVLASFQSVMKEMSIRGHVDSNVALGVSIRSDSRYDEAVQIPTKKDIKELLRAAEALSNSKNQTIAKPWQRYRPMLYLAIDSGMRPQEYLAAATKDLRDTGIHVVRAIEGDGSRISVTKTPAGRRFIDLSPDIFRMVTRYADELTTPNKFDLIFPDRNGKWQCRRNWQRRGFDIACEKAGLMEEVEVEGETVTRPKYRPYDLRHFYASVLIERKVNLKKIQTLMGHTNIETTLNVYGHLLEDSSLARQKGALGELL